MAATSRLKGPTEASWIATLLLLAALAWSAYNFSSRTPSPLPFDAPLNSFSEGRARRHLDHIASVGPHPVGSPALDSVHNYLLQELEWIEEHASGKVVVEVDVQEGENGVSQLSVGPFSGKSLAYQGLRNVVVRVRGAQWGVKDETSESWHAVLLSVHTDSVYPSPGASDDAASVAILLELIRTFSLSFPASVGANALLFLFNEGEEEGLDGAHAFITKHRWSDNVRVAIDLEAMGSGGPHTLFQAGPSNWLLNHYVESAPHPAGNIVAQDIFLNNLINSATDFQVYRDVGGLSGLDFAYIKRGHVYHTKNDRPEYVQPGALQHSGDNLEALLRRVVVSTELAEQERVFPPEGSSKPVPYENVFFDFLGLKLISYPFAQAASSYLTLSAILPVLVLLPTIFPSQKGPAYARVTIPRAHFFLVPLTAFLTQALTLVGGLVMAGSRAYLLAVSKPWPNPAYARPWLVVPLYGGAALAGAIGVQGLGAAALRKVLAKTPSISVESVLFRASLLQWFALLVVMTRAGVGSAYIPLLWALAGTLACTVRPKVRMEASLLSTPGFAATALAASLTATAAIGLTDVMNSSAGRFDKSPGASPVYLLEVVISILVAVFALLATSYFLPYAHSKGLKSSFTIAAFFLAVSSIAAGLVTWDVFPPFTAEAALPINLVHVYDTSAQQSYISLSSLAPGRSVEGLVAGLGARFNVSRGSGPDFVTYEVGYGARTVDAVPPPPGVKTEAPSFALLFDHHVAHELETGVKEIDVGMHAGGSRRWALGIDVRRVQGFSISSVTGDGRLDRSSAKVLVPMTVDPVASDSKAGWHIVQFAAGSGPADDFVMKLRIHPDAHVERLNSDAGGAYHTEGRPLLKLRTDFDVTTPHLQAVLDELPVWTTEFGKSTSPYRLAYLASFDFE